jgi:succinoglycan biosynthesis transport protein ExoP
MNHMSISPAGGGNLRRGEPSPIGRYYKTVRSHLILIAVCTVLTVAAAVAYVAVAPRSYTAESQVVVNPAVSTDTVLFALPVLHSSGDPTQDVLTAASLLHTPQIAQATITTLHLGLSPQALLARTTIVPEDESNILSISATAPNAAQAQRLASAFAREAIVVRTSTLHQAIAAELPTLRASAAQTPLAERDGTGSVGSEISELEQLAAGPDPTVSLNALATLPGSPTSPKTKLSLAIGVVVGLLLGIAAAFALDAFDPRIRREEQVREIFPGISVLARVPRRDGAVRVGPLMPLDLPARAVEQYRTLRATLGPREPGESRAYLVTGTGPSEGKTTSAINLAVALAQSGAEVILIDADLRRPTIATSFGLQRFRSTEQVLNGDVNVHDALQKVKVGPARFNVLAAHGRNAELADRLSPAGAERLVKAAQELADVVVIDSPPLTAVVDALPFAEVVDSVVLAVRMEQTKLSKLVEAVELLSYQGVRPSGFILIGVRESEDSGYGYAAPQEDGVWPGDVSPPPETSVLLGRRPSRP